MFAFLVAKKGFVSWLQLGVLEMVVVEPADVVANEMVGNSLDHVRRTVTLQCTDAGRVIERAMSGWFGALQTLAREFRTWHRVETGREDILQVNGGILQEEHAPLGIGRWQSVGLVGNDTAGSLRNATTTVLGDGRVTGAGVRIPIAAALSDGTTNGGYSITFGGVGCSNLLQLIAYTDERSGSAAGRLGSKMRREVEVLGRVSDWSHGGLRF